MLPERMKKVTVIGPKAVMEKTVKELHKLKAVHVIDHQRGELELDIGSPFEKAGRLSELLVAIRSVSSVLGISGKKELSNGFRAVGVRNLVELERAARTLNAGVNTIMSGLKSADEELKRLGIKDAQLSFLKNLGLGLAAFSGYRSLACFAGTVKDAKKLRQSLLAITDRFELFTSEEKSGFGIALFVSLEKKGEAAEALARNGFSEVQLTEVKDLSGSVPAAMEAVARKKEKLQRQKESGEKSLLRLGRKWNDFLLLAEQLISIELEKAQAPLRFAVSKGTFVVTGWVPSKELGALEERLNMATGERIFVDAALPHHGDKVPVKLSNPGHAKPFEFFMRLYALPRYDEIDPTSFMFITFPLFFGFILGDIGYGLVTFFLLLWLKGRIPKSAPLVNVVIPASVSSIIFGFLFGEAFGFESVFGTELPRLLSRAHAINELLVISVVIGLFHINLGFILGFFNELRHKGLFKAFAGKLSWVFLELGVALAVLSIMGRIGLPAYVGGGAAVLAVMLITMAEGFRGPIEIPGLLSNLMSYARLGAVGLSSVILAVVINDMAAEMFHGGVIGSVAAVIVLFVGHTINLALGLLGSFLHSLRLHYVEFFTKFFEGGAIPFRPFGTKTG
ncbi:V-type ATP synthase subunit I [Candidatus Woesearchaeota archaeon]|nr:V-type ATP synthase subunit I [Candidatus Woesearchaeota archaeon]